MANNRKPWPPQIYHHKARNTDRVAVYDAAGKRHFLTLGPHDSDQARQEYLRIVAELEANGRVYRLAPRGPGLLVISLLDQYYTHAEARYGGRRNGPDFLWQVRHALKVVRRLYGRVPVAEFGPLALRAVRRAMIDGSWQTPEERADSLARTGGRPGWARAYINRLVMIIRLMFKWAVSMELVPAEALTRLEAVPALQRGEEGVREGRGKVRPVADPVVEKTLPVLSPTVADIIRLLRLTGCRCDEILPMRPRDVDQSGRDPAGRVWPGLWIYTVAEHKTDEHTGEAKLVFLGPQAQEILRPYLDRPADAFCFSPRESRTSLQATRGPGERYLVGSIGKAVERAAHRAGVPHWHPHQLRHSAGTAIREKFDLDAAGAALGHGSLSSTQIYAEKALAKAAEVARAMG